jgi:hypothetical protein
MQLNNLRDLEEWLTLRGIDISSWGRGGAKTVIDLWYEVVSEEVELQDSPPMRIIQVAQAAIRKGDAVLVEAEQVLDDGQRRSRNLLPSEKMKPGESYTDAVLRCLKEELDIDREYVTIIADSYRQEQKKLLSPSYPGLLTQYTFHRVDVVAEGLPDGSFWRDNVAYGEGDPVKQHYWVWREWEDAGIDGR